MEPIRRHAPDVLAALFGLSGAVRLVRPTVFESLIPGWLSNPRIIVYGSGAAELICAVGLYRRARRAATASALVLVAVFPGNIQQALDAVRSDRDRLSISQLFILARLPLQIPLIWAALQATVRDDQPVAQKGLRRRHT